MDGVSADQELQFQSAHQLCLSNKKSFRNLEIPPPKLLTRRLAALSSEPSMEMYHHLHRQQNDSPRVLPEEIFLQKFLPNSGVDDDAHPYASDEFRMYEFKIRKCTRSRSHDWTDCPFAHPGEKARRRCPRRFGYSGTVCADFRRGSCIRGDTCEFAHGVFECWLHPSRYRTEACKDGKNCQRKVCFFAHTSIQLRSLPPSEMMLSPNRHVNSGHCPYCRCHPSIHHTTSPTSILDIDKLSPPSSPPISPAQPGGGFSPISRFSDNLVRKDPNAGSSYKFSRNELMAPQALTELMHKMKMMNMKAIDQAPNLNPVMMDSFAACNDDKQSLFSVSPSTPFPSASGSSLDYTGDCNYAMNNFNEGRLMNETLKPVAELKWVNDLLT